MTPSQRLHKIHLDDFQIGTALDIGAMTDCLAALHTGVERLTKAHLAQSIHDQKREAAEVKKYADRISALAGALDARLSAHLLRKPKAA